MHYSVTCHVSRQSVWIQSNDGHSQANPHGTCGQLQTYPLEMFTTTRECRLVLSPHSGARPSHRPQGDKTNIDSSSFNGHNLKAQYDANIYDPENLQVLQIPQLQVAL
jgi:hypothetical protein